MSHHRLHVAAGPLSAEFDPATAWLRHVRLGGVEVVRAVYPAVRDRHWNTLPNVLSQLHVQERPGGFQATFNAACGEAYGFRGTIEGFADGTLVYRFEGEARAALERNRIGLCLLHPIVERGDRSCAVEHTDGTTTASEFPQAISPHQPFFNVRAIRFAGVEARCEGDEFETEDQRNWTDASFKTYSTPLRHSWPVPVTAGERVVQTVTLKAVGGAPAVDTLAGSQVRANLAMKVGLGCCDRALTLDELRLLRDVRPSHLRVDLAPDQSDVVAKLRLAAEQARVLGTALEIALLCPDEPQPGLASLAEVVAELRPPVGSWLVARQGSGVGTVAALRMARRLLPAARFGIGTNGYFAELNRNLPDAAEADFVFFSVNPQVHAFDDESIMETLDGQRWVVEAARQLTGKPVAVTPVTLRPRVNPHARAAGVAHESPSEIDARLYTDFAADWTLGSIRALREAGAESATYFQTAGACGIVDGEVARPVCAALASL